MSNEHERFYTTVPMVGTIPENSSGGGGTGLQPVVCGKVAAACTDRIGGAGVVTHGVVGVATQSDALREALWAMPEPYEYLNKDQLKSIRPYVDALRNWKHRYRAVLQEQSK